MTEGFLFSLDDGDYSNFDPSVEEFIDEFMKKHQLEFIWAKCLRDKTSRVDARPDWAFHSKPEIDGAAWLEMFKHMNDSKLDIFLRMGP